MYIKLYLYVNIGHRSGSGAVVRVIGEVRVDAGRYVTVHVQRGRSTAGRLTYGGSSMYAWFRVYVSMWIGKCGYVYGCVWFDIDVNGCVLNYITSITK